MQGAGLVAMLAGLVAWGLTGDGDEADEWRLLRRREGYEDAREVLLAWTTYEDVRACLRACRLLCTETLRHTHTSPLSIHRPSHP